MSCVARIRDDSDEGAIQAGTAGSASSHHSAVTTLHSPEAGPHVVSKKRRVFDEVEETIEAGTASGSAFGHHSAVTPMHSPEPDPSGSFEPDAKIIERAQLLKVLAYLKFDDGAFRSYVWC